MVNADEVVLASVGEQIQSNVLHRETKVCGRRWSNHRVSRLGRKDANTVLASRNQLPDIVCHPGPEVQTTS